MKINVKRLMELCCPQSGPFMVQCEGTLAKRLKNGQNKNNISYVQLHHPSQLMEPCSKVNVKQVNELWCPQSNPRPISLYGVSDGRTHVQTDGRTDFRHY